MVTFHSLPLLGAFIKKARQRLSFLRWLKRLATSFYRCTIELHTDWLYHRLVRQLHRPPPQDWVVVKSAPFITGVELWSIKTAEQLINDCLPAITGCLHTALHTFPPTQTHAHPHSLIYTQCILCAWWIHLFLILIDFVMPDCLAWQEVSSSGMLAQTQDHNIFNFKSS